MRCIKEERASLAEGMAWEKNYGMMSGNMRVGETERGSVWLECRGRKNRKETVW